MFARAGSDFVSNVSPMSEVPAGWVRLGALTFTQRLGVGAAARAWVLFGLLVVGAQFMSALLRFWGVDPRWSFVLGFAIAIAVFVVVVFVTAGRHPTPMANFQTQQLRSGRTTVSLTDIDTAILSASHAVNARHLALHLKMGKKTAVIVPLLSRNQIILGEEERRLWAEVLRSTRVAMPSSPDDPKGRFARYNFPGHMDKDTAIDVVQRTPRAGEPLPISPAP